MSDRSEEALVRFQNGFNCSQTVLSAFAEDYDLDLEVSLKLACGFGGGIGRTAGTCGAVTGAVMVLGLVYCEPDQLAPATKARVYALVQGFIREFTERHRTTSCRELLECDIDTAGGYLDAQERGLFQSRCPNYVKDAVEILEEML